MIAESTQTSPITPSSCATTVEEVEYSALSGNEQEKILVLQQNILEAVALGQDHMEVINRMCKLEEQLLPNSVASVMLLDKKHQLNVYAAPSIPPEGIAQLNGLEPGPHAGSCGNVIYRQEPIFVSDTLTDPRWDDLRSLAINFGLMACWSFPVRSEGGKIIGTFALSSFERRAPSSFHRKILEIGASIIGIVLERRKDRDALRKLNASLEKRVAEEVAKNREKDHILIQQSRLAMMGEMMRNVAHHWRQPLSTLTLILQNIKDDYEYGELSRETLDKQIANGNMVAQKMSATIDDFRNFFKTSEKMTRFNLMESIREALSLMDATFQNEKIEIMVETPHDVFVEGLFYELSQVLLNVFANAKDAIKAKGGPGEISIQLALENGMGVIRICDNGGGIPEDVRPKIFDPYFTTKEVGSGIGLYMSRMILEQMKGRIEAHNIDGGTEMVILVPACSQSIQ